MTDHMEIRHLPPGPWTPDTAAASAGGRILARPVGRAVVPAGMAGRRGFLVLLVSGLAINAWALFPSTVESAVYVPLPQLTMPSAAEGNSAPKGVTDDIVGPRSATFFKLMTARPVSSGPATHRSLPYYLSPAAAVSMVPLRSKLQALLMVLWSRYGEDIDAAALELKLQQLLKLPDSVLAQLIRHPDLADLNAMLDSVFLTSADLSGIQTELNKIDISTTSGPTEQIDVVRVNGEPTYVVYSAAAQPGSESAAVMAMSAIPQPPAEFRVLSAVEAPAVLAAFALAPAVETFAPVPAPVVAEFVAPPVVAEFVAPPVVAEFVAPPVVTELAAPETFVPETFVPETFAPDVLTSVSPTTPEQPVDVAPSVEDIGKPEDVFDNDEADAEDDGGGAGGTVTTGGGDDTPTSQHGAPPSSSDDSAGSDDTGGATQQQDSPSGSDSGGGDSGSSGESTP